MNDNQNTYNPPPMPPRMSRTDRWKERWRNRLGMNAAAGPQIKGELTIPNWLAGRKVVAYFFVSMLVCLGLFGYAPEADLLITAIISIVLFFAGGFAMSKKWERKKEGRFIRNVFIAGLVIRLFWILYCYFIFNPDHYGTTFGDRADVEWYMPFGKAITQWIANGFDVPFNQLLDTWGSAYDDSGYPMWLGIVYSFTGVENDVFIPFLLKCLMSAYCSICIYHVAKRHFGEGVARMAAIFMCLNPNMIYWCGTMFKEAEMIFLVCLAIDNFDRVLTSGNRLSIRSLIPGILAAMALMFFRSALGLVVFVAVFAHIVMASSRVMGAGKKVLAGALVLIVLVVAMGDRIRSESNKLFNASQSNDQQVNMEWRAEREGGNSFAQYASKTVFAPLIFTIPFPTFNNALDSQMLQVQLSGGSYIKNIFSFFVIMVFFMMLISGEWRKHVFILAYTVGYHAVLALSNFAQSGRFHMPVIPMLMLFAAYGIHIAKTNGKLKRWFPIVLIIEVVICVAWNWFKLKGRGMI